MAVVLLLAVVASLGLAPEAWSAPRPPTLIVELTGVDHVWHLRYPGPDGELGGADDVFDRRDLHLPAGATVELRVTSEDYIYRLWSPPLGLNQMVIPGKVLTARLAPDREGEYELRGEPMCGLKLDDMDAVIRVLSPEDFSRWLLQGRE